MTPTQQLEAFAQSVYMMIKNRYYGDLTTADGQNYLNMVVDWTNMFIDELQTEVNSDGQPIDWIWVRQLMQNLGTATYTPNAQGQPWIAWNNTLYNNLCIGTERFVQIIDANDNTLSNWTVVDPTDMSNSQYRNTLDMCSVVANSIVFSRPFTQAEGGCAIYGDVTTWFPPLTTTVVSGQIEAVNVGIFSTVKPLTLLKLGVAKNAILPDIVMGGLNPSYTQKYNDLLTNAINQSTRSAISPTADYDDMTMITGVGF